MLMKWIKRSFVVGMTIMVIAPSFAQANASNLLYSFLENNKQRDLVKPSWSEFILHLVPLREYYSSNGFQTHWIDQQGRPNSHAMTLRQILLQADRHGLNPNDYWDGELDRIAKIVTDKPHNGFVFDIAVTESLIRYVSHLSNGRFDPSAIDQDIRFQKKAFTDYKRLASVVASGSANLQSGLDSFMPQNEYYRNLMIAMNKMKASQAQGGWRSVSYPKTALKLGVQSDVVPQLRARLRQLGYGISDAGGNVFDAELDQVVRSFQSDNGMVVDGIVGTNSEVIRAMNISVSDRIEQIQINMEKLRWLPRSLESRHAFINLATNEFKMTDNGQVVFDFKTISGQAFRRTPTMRDRIFRVDFNPTWTVPRSIIIKDKIPQMRADKNYLKDHDFEIIYEGTDTVVTDNIDFRNMTSREFFGKGYSLRQKPSFTNALGRVIFRLTNGDLIYLHDTNERALFKVDPTSRDLDFRSFKRNLSSGCVRLEYPLEFAAYVLNNNLKIPNEDWSLSKIESFVSSESMPIAPRKNWTRQVELKTYIPVYMMNLTVALTQDGRVRFVPDVYGQDKRVGDAIRNLKVGGELF